jgi:hypothetical protein
MFGDDPVVKPQPSSKADRKADGALTAEQRARRRAALEKLRDMRDRSLAEKDADSAAHSDETYEALLARLGRPPRVVSAPELTSADVDSLLETTLTGTKVVPAKLVDDETFARRATLDLTGKLPKTEALVAFRRNKDPKKRAKLVDALLADADFGTNWARFWRDVIAHHATTTQIRLANYAEFETWMATQLRANRPWDEIAKDILTATGDTRENGATMMIMAHTDQRFAPVEMAGEASRVFMGIQISCAQCHDHKTDSWKRVQFHEFAAFFAGVQPRRSGKAPDIQVAVVDRPGRMRHTMPDLDDPSHQIPVEPRFFLASDPGESLNGLNSAERRSVAASYITGQDNPWFAKSYINRVWYALMGESFFETVDDLGPEREARAPEVLDALAEAWVRGGYDVKWLFRVLMNTRAYQRQARSTQSPAGRQPFASNCPARLRSDQILDNLSQVLNLPLDRTRVAPPPATGEMGAVPAIVERVRQGRPRNQFNSLFGFDPSLLNDDVLGTIPQALFLMNAPAIKRGIEAKRGGMLTELLAKTPDNRAAVEALYLQVLARSPTNAEIKTCLAYIAKVGNRREAFEDLLWALVNSTEFVSRR